MTQFRSIFTKLHLCYTPNLGPADAILVRKIAEKSRNCNKFQNLGKSCFQLRVTFKIPNQQNSGLFVLGQLTFSKRSVVGEVYQSLWKRSKSKVILAIIEMTAKMRYFYVGLTNWSCSCLQDLKRNDEKRMAITLVTWTYQNELFAITYHNCIEYNRYNWCDPKVNSLLTTVAGTVRSTTAVTATSTFAVTSHYEYRLHSVLWDDVLHKRNTINSIIEKLIVNNNGIVTCDKSAFGE